MMHMNRERYQRIRAIIEEVCDSPHEQRAAILDSACGDDNELRTDVDALLSHLETPAIGFDDVDSARLELLADLSANDRSFDAALPERIGPYRILRLLGEGGMGVVYLAEQDNPRRQVAIKIIRPGFTTPTLLRRFEHEVHVLGRLQHPNIAQIYSAGTADAGSTRQPYLVMEYIDGCTLLEYTSAHGLSTRERLELFNRICEAVQHAHQRGIIHRDLKPANILVGQEGSRDQGTKGPKDRGTRGSRRWAGHNVTRPLDAFVKILDFGVARASDPEVQVTTLAVGGGQIIGTLPYMSPEQLGGDVTDVDTRCDVYALGVILFELLTGRLPHDFSRRSVPEITRIIREQEPLRLSAIDQRLRGDLDTILAKALEKDKRRRYQTVREFSQDIARHLNDEPILARRTSTLYQIRKFARRNKVMVTAALLVALTLVIAAGTSTWGMMTARASDRLSQAHLAAMNEARLEAEEQARRATVEYQKGRQIFDLLSDLLAGANPDSAPGQELTVRQMLDDAAMRLRHEILDPETRLALLVHIGRLHHRLGNLDLAEELLDEAVMGMRWSGTTTLAELSSATRSLASVLKGKGRLAEAEATVLEAIDTALLVDADLDVAEAVALLASIHRDQRDHASAEELYLEAGEIFAALGRQGRSGRARVLDGLANLYVTTARYDEAEVLHQESLALRREIHGDVHSAVASSMNNYAILLDNTDRPEEAAQLYHDALEIRRRLYGEEHPEVATTLYNLALSISRTGDYARAVEIGEKSLAMRRRLLGQTHPRTLTTAAVLGGWMTELDRADEAEALLTEVIDGFRETTIDDYDLAGPLQNFGWLRFRQNRLEEARDILREAMEVYQRHGKSLAHSSALGRLSRVHLALGEPAEAEATARESIDMRRELVARDDSSIATTMLTLARAMELVGDIEQSIEVQRQSLEIQRHIHGGGHYQVGMSLGQLGRTIARAGGCKEAELMLLESIEILATVSASAARASASASDQMLCQCLVAQGRHEKAEERGCRINGGPDDQ